MADNQGLDLTKYPSSDSIPEIARNHVYLHVKSRLEKTDTHVTFAKDEVYVVWFCFILGNYKALVSTSLPDGRYYEVTCSGDRKKVFIDTYVKVDNTEYDLIPPQD